MNYLIIYLSFSLIAHFSHILHARTYPFSLVRYLAAHPEDEHATDEARRRRAIQLPRMPGAQGGGGRNKRKTKFEDLVGKDLKDILSAKSKIPAYAHMDLRRVGNVSDVRDRVMNLVREFNLSFEDCWPIVAVVGGDGGAGIADGEEGGEEVEAAAAAEEGEEQDPDAMDVDQQPGEIVDEHGANDQGLEYESEIEDHEEAENDLPPGIEEVEEVEEVVEVVGGERRSGRAHRARQKHSPDDIIPCACGCRRQYEYHEMDLCRLCGPTTGKYIRRRCVMRTFECETCRNSRQPK